MAEQAAPVLHRDPGLTLCTVAVCQTRLRGWSARPPHEMYRIQVSFSRLDRELPAPTRAHEGDAGWDLRTVCDFALPPRGRATVGTGVAVAIPHGFAGLVVPRSGLAAKHGIGVVNGPGLIDSGYRGEIRVVLVNHGEDEVHFRRGERIAQLLVVPAPQVDWVEVDTLPEGDRGEAGFGSTGT